MEHGYFHAYTKQYLYALFMDGLWVLLLLFFCFLGFFLVFMGVVVFVLFVVCLFVLFCFSQMFYVKICTISQAMLITYKESVYSEKCVISLEQTLVLYGPRAIYSPLVHSDRPV